MQGKRDLNKKSLIPGGIKLIKFSEKNPGRHTLAGVSP